MLACRTVDGFAIVEGHGVKIIQLRDGSFQVRKDGVGSTRYYGSAKNTVEDSFGSYGEDEVELGRALAHFALHRVGPTYPRDE